MSEMTPMSTLTERIGALAQLKELKNEIAENLKSCNAQIEQAEKEIIASMLDLADAAGLDDPSGFTVDVAGRRYGIKVKPFYSIRKDQRDEAFAALRALGLGDLIVLLRLPQGRRRGASVSGDVRAGREGRGAAACGGFRHPGG